MIDWRREKLKGRKKKRKVRQVLKYKGRKVQIIYRVGANRIQSRKEMGWEERVMICQPTFSVGNTCLWKAVKKKSPFFDARFQRNGGGGGKKKRTFCTLVNNGVNSASLLKYVNEAAAEYITHILFNVFLFSFVSTCWLFLLSWFDILFIFNESLNMYYMMLKKNNKSKLYR